MLILASVLGTGLSNSSKPTGGPGSLPGGSSRGAMAKAGLAAADWMCTVCGCNNFARRVVCFQVWLKCSLSCLEVFFIIHCNLLSGVMGLGTH